MGVNFGGAIEGAGTGASIGSAGGGYGAAIGGIVGGIAGLFSKKPATSGSTTTGLATPSGGSSGMPSLTDALSKGLGSLTGLGRTQPMNITQTQTVNQATDVNVTNVLGGRTFGDTDLETGEFDIFKTIADVYAIRDAQAVNMAQATPRASGVQTEEKKNILPLVLLAGGGVALLYFFTKGK